MFSADQASKGLGIELIEAGDGRAVVRMRVAQTMINGHGIAHGGFVFILADTAFSCACNTYGPVTVAAGADISFLCPVREGDVLVATASRARDHRPVRDLRRHRQPRRARSSPSSGAAAARLARP